MQETKKNKKADDHNDVAKLFGFFAEMKAANEKFFCDVQIDSSVKIKTFSGPTQAAGLHTKISAML
jgi:hypothetical protein